MNAVGEDILEEDIERLKREIEALTAIYRQFREPVFKNNLIENLESKFYRCRRHIFFD